MRFCLLSLCLLSISFFAHAQQEARTRFSPQEVNQDLDYLLNSLEETHYNLYAYSPREAIQEKYRELKTQIGADSISRKEATDLFQRLISRVNNGHTEIDFPAQDYIQHIYAEGTVFPLELAFEEGNALVRANYSDNPDIRKGLKVVSINGQPIAQVLEQIYSQLSAERSYFKNAKLELWSFPRMYWQLMGQKDTFDVTVANESGGQATHTLKAVPALEYEQSRTEVMNTKREFRFYDQVAYLNPGPFAAVGADDSEARYQQFIDSAFAEIRKKQPHSLIIDLRNNSGGHNAYSDYLTAYIANRPFKWHSEFRLKTSALLKEHTRASGDTTDAYERAILNHPDGESFPYAFKATLPVEEAKRFTGKVYVLINRQSHSMATVAAATFKDHGFATLVGEETGEYPTLYASQFTYPLPNTGIMVKVSKGLMVRPNGSRREKGLIPDIRIRDHLLDEEDEILKDLLKKIETNN